MKKLFLNSQMKFLFLFTLLALSSVWGGPRTCHKVFAMVASHGTEASIAYETGLDYETNIAPKAITRKVRGKTATYFDKNGKQITDQKELERIAELKIPLVYKDVVISSNPNSHLQYTAVDTSGKKQYRYHPFWNEARQNQKFKRIEKFGASLPSLRRAVEKDLKGSELSKARVLAAMLRILDKTAIRVGNEEFAAENETYGLSTLEKRHVKVKGNKVILSFVGKASKEQVIEFEDADAAKVITQLQKISGKELFPYSSSDVNEYIADNMNHAFTAKDFRTWMGTVEAYKALKVKGATRKDAVTAASEKLGNTPAVAEKSYIHPSVLESFENGDLKNLSTKVKPGLSSVESAVLSLIENSF